MTTTSTCLNCGEYVRLADRFCSRCGTELTLGTHATALFPDRVLPGDDPESPWIEVLHRLRRATLGEFEVGRELGRGGMAAVFLAHEIALDRKVAIKVMSPGLLMGDGMIERFKREAITIAHLNHPNIVSCYSVRQAEGLHFFVMRYIRGRSLDQLIHSGPIPVPIVRSILCQVGAALTYAHRSRVVHRDIKPANILVGIDGSAVVTDFGIAKVAELPGHTHTGALVGTPSYMSPEQCSGAEVSGSSDQYSLGAVAYEMVTGAPPFTGSTLTVMQAQVEEAPPPIRDRVPECPPELEAAILRMLAKDPADRFPSMAEAKVALGATPLLEDDPMLAELSRLVGADSAEAEVEAPPSPVPSRASAVRSGLSGVARSIVILPPPAELAVGDGFALVALVRGERSVPLPGRPIEWNTDSSGVLHIDRIKQVATAVSPGTVWLTARCDGIESRVQVRVPPALADAYSPGLDEPAAAIRISSPPKSVRTGDSFFLTAVPLDQAGEPLLEPTVLWNTSDVRVAVVTAEGWVAALGRGQVLLTATRGGASASVTIDVEHAIPPSRPLWREAPVRAEPLPDDSHRTAWRRRGTRTRRLVAQGLVSGLAVAGSLYLFGGLRDFRADRERLTELAADYMKPVETDTDTTAPAAAESIPAINRGTAAPVALTRRPRRQPAAVPAESAARRMSPAATAADDSAQIGGTAGQADAGEAPAMETELPGDRIYPDTSAYVPLTPELGRDAADEPPAPAPLRAAKPALPPVDRAKLESLLRDGVEDCYAALRSKDVDRVQELYRPETLADREKLRRLIRILRTEPWRAVVGRRVDGARELGARAAAAEFSLRLEWRDAMGGRLSSTPIFRAEFGRQADGWTMSSCRIVGSPKL